MLVVIIVIIAAIIDGLLLLVDQITSSMWDTVFNIESTIPQFIPHVQYFSNFIDGLTTALYAVAVLLLII